MKVKTLIIVAMALSYTLSLPARDRELELRVGAGASSFSLSHGIGLGYVGGLGYNHYFNSNIALSLGVNAGLIRGTSTGDGLKSTVTDLIDRYDDPYELRTTIVSYREKQSLTMMSIPLTLQFMPGKSEHGRFYFRLGASIDFPLNAEYRATDYTVDNTGYYTTLNNEVHAPKFAGFGLFDRLNIVGEMHTKISLNAMLELGYHARLSDRWSFYAGIYLSYGVLDIRRDDTAPFVIVNPDDPERFGTRSILASRDAEGHDFARHVSPVIAGFNLRFAFNTSRSRDIDPDANTDPDAEHLLAEEQPATEPDHQAQEPDHQAQEADHEAPAYEPPTLALDKPSSKGKKGKSKATQQATDPSVMPTDPSASTSTISTEQSTLSADQSTPVPSGQHLSLAAIKTLTKPIHGFGDDLESLSKASRDELDSKVAILKTHPWINVIIVGHTDEGNTPVATAEELSQSRADAARDYLVAHGIDAKRITTIAKGNVSLAVPNTNEHNRMINRRVEFRIQ